jgi:hypothetical protein
MVWLVCVYICVCINAYICVYIYMRHVCIGYQKRAVESWSALMSCVYVYACMPLCVCEALALYEHARTNANTHTHAHFCAWTVL